MKKLILVAAILTLSGCAGKPIMWDKAGATQEGFNRDQRECKYDVQKNTQGTDPGMRTIIGQEMERASRQRDLMISCMESRGYTAQE